MRRALFLRRCPVEGQQLPQHRRLLLPRLPLPLRFQHQRQVDFLHLHPAWAADLARPNSKAGHRQVRWKAKAIQAAGKRKASPQEACKLIGAFSQSELKMIKFVETNTVKCQIPPQAAEQMKKGHANTEQLLTKVCAAAANGGGPQGPAAPSLSEALGSASLPEAKATKRSGGSTFDTLNGNVLAR